MSATEQTHASDLEELVERLGEPGTVAALNSLLDNAALVAVLVAGLDGLARKGDVVSDTIAEVIAELRGAGRATGLDVRTTTRQLATLIPILAEAAPAVERVAHSPIVADEAVAVVGASARALTIGFERARTAAPPRGALGVLRATRDEDVRRGLGFLIEVARALGQELRAQSEAPGGN